MSKIFQSFYPIRQITIARRVIHGLPSVFDTNQNAIVGTSQLQGVVAALIAGLRRRRSLGADHRTGRPLLQVPSNFVEHMSILHIDTAFGAEWQTRLVPLPR